MGSRLIFIDTSVIIAILSEEDDADSWSDKIEAATRRATSTLVLVEAIMRLTTKLSLPVVTVSRYVDDLVARSAIEIVPIESVDRAFATDAFARYGKGRGHPAQLNLADCLSYACARRRGLTLLYKGNDFAKTDLA